MNSQNIFITHALAMFIQHDSHNDGYELSHDVREFAGDWYCVFRASNYGGKIVGVAIHIGNRKAVILDEENWPVFALVEELDWEAFMEENKQ